MAIRNSSFAGAAILPIGGPAGQPGSPGKDGTPGRDGVTQDISGLLPKTGDASSARVTPALTGAQALDLATAFANRVDPRFLRLPGDPDWTAALQRAGNIACATNKALELPGGLFLLTSAPVTLTKPISIIGDGEANSLIVGVHLGPIFIFDVEQANFAGDFDRFCISGFTARGQYGPGDDYSNTSAFKVIGDAATFFTYGSFSDLSLQGFYQGFDFDKATFTTPFGQESPTSWNTFARIKIRHGSRYAIYGYRYRRGSGTGVTYTDQKMTIGPGGCLIQVDAGVAGDIIVVGAHLGGIQGTGGAVVGLGAGTVYRCNISVVGSQLDAGLDHAFAFPAGGVVPSRIVYVGNNTGGGVDVTGNLPPLANSIIHDQLVDDRRVQNTKGGAVSGAANDPSRTVPVAKLTVGPGASGQPYNGVVLDVSLFGLLGGLAGAAARANILVSNSGGSASATVLGLQQDAATGFSITATVSGATVTINAVYPAAASGDSYVEAQITARGGGSYGLAKV